MENWTIRKVVENLTMPYSCTNAIVYRLASPVADHYFFINDDEQKTTSIKFSNFKYKNITDAISGESVNPNSIAIESNSGRWVRCEK